MAKVVAGEAAVRIVPTLRGFHNRVDAELKRKPHSISVGVDPNFKSAEAQMAAWRKRQQADALNIPVRAKTDFAGFRRDIRQVEHIFKRSSLGRAVRLNLVVAGLDALPALSLAAGSAASGLDALGKSALALPGLLGGALASVGALAAGLNGVGDALKAYGEDAADAAQNAKKARDADRDLARSKRDLRNAIRDQRREIEDLNSELRRSSLNEADALLNVQEAVDRLREGGFKSITEFQRAQLGLLQSIDHLNETRKQTSRTAEDAAQANRDGIAQADRVVDALDRVADATERLNESNVSKVSEALGKLAPNARSGVEAIHGLSGAWNTAQGAIQQELWQDLDRVITDLGRRGIPVLQNGLSKVAEGLNTNVKAVASSLGSGQNLGLLDRIFGNTKGGLENLSRGMDPLISAFTKLTEVGSRFLPRLGDAFTQVAIRFENFINSAAEDGRLEKWIDQGLDALTSLGNAAINVGSIISSVAQAFNSATGTEGGFIGSLERGTKRLAEFLRSTEGQNTLVSYFQRARDFVVSIIDSLRSAKTVLGDIVDTAREWSEGFFAVVGALAQTADWIERNTGLLKPLLFAYLTIRTVRPLVEGLTTAWQFYGRTIESLANYDLTSRHFTPAANGMRQFKSQLSAVGGVAAGASSQIQFSADAVKNVNKQAFTALAPVNNLTGQFGKLEGAAGNAAGKVGGGIRQSVGSLGKSLSGLGSFIAPNAAFMGAVIGLTTGIETLGKAHEEAARQADKQKAALEGLKTTLDDVTGNATLATLGQNAKNFENFTIPGVGDVNINQQARELGIDPTQFNLAAADPTQQGLKDKIQGNLDKAVASRIESDPGYQKFKKAFDDAGITSLDIAKAVRSDPTALAQYRAFMEKSDAALSIGDFTLGGTGLDADIQRLLKGGKARVPTLTDFLKTAGPAGNLSFALGNTAGSQGDQARANAAAADVATGGPWKLSAAGAAAFGGFAPDPNPRKDPGSNQGVITLNRKPDQATIDSWNERGWQVTDIAGNRVQVTVPVDAANNFLQKFRSGGLVGGRGTGTSDSNLAMLSKGEWVTRKKAVDHYGQAFFDDLNNMRLPKFAVGGGWGLPLKPPVPPPTPPVKPFIGPIAPAKPAPTNVPYDPHLNPAFGYKPSPLIGVRANPSLAGMTPRQVLDRAGAPRPAPPPIQVSQSLPPVLQRRPTVGSAMAPWALGARKPENFYKQWYPPSGSNLPVKPPPVSDSFYEKWYPRSTPSAPKSSGSPSTPKPYTHNPPPTRQKDGTYYSPRTGHTVDPEGKVPVSGTPHGTGGSPGPHHGGATPGTPTPAGPGTPSTGPIIPVSVPGMTAPVNVALPSGIPLPDRLGGESGLQVNTIRIKRAIENAFPQIQRIGGVRADALKWHPNGLAIDVMIPGGSTRGGSNPEGKALGDQIYQMVMANKEAFGIDHVSWQTDQGGDHFDHVHIATNGGGFPTGGEQFTLPQAAAAAFGTTGIPGILAQAGVDPSILTTPQAAQSGKPRDIGEMIRSKFEDAYKPENIQEYFEGLVQNIGSSLTGIGTSFLSGVTGLDFSQVMGPLQDLGNHFLSDSESGEGSSSGATGLNAEVDANLQNFLNGDPGTSLGLAGALYNPSGGAEQWRPLVRQILQQVAPQYGITNIKAWEDAIIKQIETESSGDPNALNPNDSDGLPAIGLGQFKQATFAAHNVTGGDISDPVAQIYAMIDYVASKYGMDATGAPKQIGRGVGYKSGGLIKGRGGRDAILARVSRGEFLTNPKAVRHYGAGTFAALNAMQIPRESLPGFNTGGWWNPLLPQPTPAPPPPTPTGPAPPPPGAPGAPAPPPPPPSTPGPLPLQTPGIGAGAGLRADSAPSTGGAPGPGATAPAPETSPLPQVTDALAGIGGAIGQNVGAGVGTSQPGATPSNEGDARGTLGEAPASQDHLNPGLRGGIEGAWNTIGGIAGQAAAAAVAAGLAGGTMGAGAPAAGPAASATSQLVSGGFQIAGKVASGAANILSSLAVGSLTGGSTAQASGVPLLPQRAPMQSGVPQQIVNNNPTYNVTNLDDFARTQKRLEAQNVNPWIGKY